ncbi:MAG: glutathione synthase [Nitrosomonadales bacterium]|jgi:glutathione synthase|nr:glutathione synthase [Nitrosomonadales bacterium]
MSYLFILDQVSSLNIKKDTSIQLIKEFIRQKKEIYCCEINDLSIGADSKGMALCGLVNNISTQINHNEKKSILTSNFKKVFVRKDPPFNQAYLNLTFILDHIKTEGVEVINDGASLRNHNEKLSILQFKDIISPTIVSSSEEVLKAFIKKHKKVVLKPVDGMAGNGIFMVTSNDQNMNVILETMTLHNHQLIMAQKFIPDIQYGDKRIILIDGEPLPYVLARIPQNNEIRANLAKGGKGVIRKLSEDDIAIVATIKPYLRKNNFRFVGIDVIGKYLTEINVTSPTGLVEIQAQAKINFSKSIIDALS